MCRPLLALVIGLRNGSAIGKYEGNTVAQPLRAATMPPHGDKDVPVNHYARIRQLHRDGLTIRQTPSSLHHSPKMILKALADPEPVPFISSAPRVAPVFGPFRAIVDAILAADESAPWKQRHMPSSSMAGRPKLPTF